MSNSVRNNKKLMNSISKEAQELLKGWSYLPLDELEQLGHEVFYRKYVRAPEVDEDFPDHVVSPDRNAECVYAVFYKRYKDSKSNHLPKDVYYCVVMLNFNADNMGLPQIRCIVEYFSDKGFYDASADLIDGWSVNGTSLGSSRFQTLESAVLWCDFIISRSLDDKDRYNTYQDTFIVNSKRKRIDETFDPLPWVILCCFIVVVLIITCSLRTVLG